MKKYTEVEIDFLIKRIAAFKDDQTMLHLLIGWFKNNALSEGQGHHATKRRAHGAAFFAAIECLLESSVVTNKTE